VDLDPEALRGQERETVVADIRRLPFESASFDAVVSIHSIEHVPEPERVVAEAARVLKPDGAAVFVTPNRLTFSPGEIVDPYHEVELDPSELEAACHTAFREVSLLGLFGSPAYLQVIAPEQRRLRRLLALDPLGARRLLPRGARRWIYDASLRRMRSAGDPAATAITIEDFAVRAGGEEVPGALDEALDLIAVCSGRRGGDA
jgi:SAM-dependent methyltransferase